MQQNTIKKVFEYIRDFIFPPMCISCEKQGETLCDLCLSSAPISTYCEGNIYAVFSYNTRVIRSAIHALKYKNNTSLAKKLAVAMHDKILQELEYQEKFHGFTKPLLVPIPLHKKRKRQRGYNQTQLLCNELSLIDNPLYRTENCVLYKHRLTNNQTDILNRKDRLKNIKGCFCVKHVDRVRGQNIILVDDVTTTGATFKEASRVLKKAGVRKIICFAVAH